MPELYEMNAVPSVLPIIKGEVFVALFRVFKRPNRTGLRTILLTETDLISDSSLIDRFKTRMAQSIREGYIMTERKITPDSIFAAGEAAPDEAADELSPEPVRLTTQDQYKRLIGAEAARQGVLLAHLADRINIARPRLHKVLKGPVALKDELCNQLFEALGIDAVRARFCVAFLHNYKAYANPEVFLTCEALKGFYFEIATRERGEIQVQLRPGIIHEAQRRAYELLLSHQARVLENDRTLQA